MYKWTIENHQLYKRESQRLKHTPKQQKNKQLQ